MDECCPCMEGYAKSLRMIPTIICDNAGLDSSEIVSQLKVGRCRLTQGLALVHFSAQLKTFWAHLPCPAD